MELEILASQHEPNELFTFLCSICDYLIANDITLRDGETIGFSEDEKLAITRSPRVVGVAEETLKIAYLSRFTPDKTQSAARPGL